METSTSMRVFPSRPTRKATTTKEANGMNITACYTRPDLQ
jgi:hypothetical protein